MRLVVVRLVVLVAGYTIADNTRVTHCSDFFAEVRVRSSLLGSGLCLASRRFRAVLLVLYVTVLSKNEGGGGVSSQSVLEIETSLSIFITPHEVQYQPYFIDQPQNSL